jgi:hypothetical protein
MESNWNQDVDRIERDRFPNQKKLGPENHMD